MARAAVQASLNDCKGTLTNLQAYLEVADSEALLLFIVWVITNSLEVLKACQERFLGLRCRRFIRCVTVEYGLRCAVSHDQASALTLHLRQVTAVGCGRVQLFDARRPLV